MAVSVDGYIADRFGGVGWLDPFNSVDAGYEAFIAGIGTVVVGRATYDQALGFPGGWAYEGKRGIVVTSSPLVDPPEGVARWDGDLAALIDELRADPDDKEAGAIDTLDLFVIPVLLGDGVRMFPTSGKRQPLKLTVAETLGLGMVRLSYAPADAPG